MNFEPPDFTKDVSFGSGGSHQNKGNTTYQRVHFQNKQDCSPLLRPNPPNKHFDSDGQSSAHNRNNCNQRFKMPLHNRLGNKNFQYRNNNMSQQTNGGNLGERNFNRKRISDTNTGPMVPKRKWPNKPFYQNSGNQQNHISVQNRLNRIRSATSLDSNLNSGSYSESEKTTQYLNDSQELDPTDITVQVVNNSAAAVAQDDHDNIIRFKMILDPKTQTAIHLLQQKRKDKQVIFPFPVTPNVTGISLHERFSKL